jgi:hypothetical protein
VNRDGAGRARSRPYCPLGRREKIAITVDVFMNYFAELLKEDV